jgi:hypothetical protein
VGLCSLFKIEECQIGKLYEANEQSFHWYRENKVGKYNCSTIYYESLFIMVFIVISIGYLIFDTCGDAECLKYIKQNVKCIFSNFDIVIIQIE